MSKAEVFAPTIESIIRIEGTSTAHMSLEESIRRMRGEEGTEVTITIKSYSLNSSDSWNLRVMRVSLALL